MNYSPHHTAISVRNLDLTVSFYTKLGFRQVHRYDDEDKIGVKLKLDDYVLEIFAYTQNQSSPELQLEVGNDLTKIGVKHIGFAVDNIDAALTDIKNKGLATEATEILSKGTARFFFVKDPDGVWVEFIKDDRY